MSIKFPDLCTTDEQKKEFLETIIRDKTYASEEERVAVGSALANYLNNGSFTQN